MPQHISRAKRLEDAMAKLDDVTSVVEELKTELEEWRENLPENLQGGSKADMLDAAIENLQEILDAIENAKGFEVDFPSARG